MSLCCLWGRGKDYLTGESSCSDWLFSQCSVQSQAAEFKNKSQEVEQ